MKLNPWIPLENLDDNQVAPPVSDAQLDSFTARYSLQLPREFVRVYRLQNGGLAHFHDSLFSIDSDRRHRNICTLSEMEADQGTEAEYTEEKRQSLGDLDRVLIICGDGHIWTVLNYNDAQKPDEPTVWNVSLDGHCVKTADTFEDWLRMNCSPYSN